MARSERIARAILELAVEDKEFAATLGKAGIRVKDLEKAFGPGFRQNIDAINARVVAMGTAIGTFVGRFAYDAVRRLGGELIEIAQRGIELAPVQQAFENLTAAIGQSGNEMVAVSREKTKGLIADLDLMASANKALLLGLPVTKDSFGTLAESAVVLGKAMKLDAKQSLDDFITALGRSSPMILDNLGLTVKVGEANEAYARSLGKTSSQLTENEKKLAFYNAAVDAAKQKVEELGGIHLTLDDHVQRLRVRFLNFTDALGVAIATSPVLTEMFASLTEEIDRAFGTDQTKKVSDFSLMISNLALDLVDLSGMLVKFARFIGTAFFSLRVVFFQVMQWIGEVTTTIGEMQLKLVKLLNALGVISDQQVASAQRELDGFKTSIVGLGEIQKEAQADLFGLQGRMDEVSAALDRMRARMIAAKDRVGETAASARGLSGELGKPDGVAGSAEAAEKALKTLNEQMDRLRGLGVVFQNDVAGALKQFHRDLGRVRAEGEQAEAVFLLGAVPALQELADKARKSGRDVTGLEAAIRAANSRLAELKPIADTAIASVGDLSAAAQVGAIGLATLGNEATVQAQLTAAAMERMGIVSREELDALARQAERDWETIVDAYREGSAEADAAYRRTLAAQLAATEDFAGRAKLQFQSFFHDIKSIFSPRGASDMLGQFLGGIENLITGGISSLINAGVRLVARGAAALGRLVGRAIGNLFGRNATKGEREKFAQEMGFGHVDELFDHLRQTLPQGQAEELITRARTRIGRNDQAANRQWMEDVRNALDEAADMVEQREQEMADAIEEQRQRVQQGFVDLMDGLEVFGRRVPAALRPMVQELMNLNGLTAEQQMLLQDMLEPADWREVQAAAERLGVSVENLGTNFNQARISDRALQYVRDLELIADAGANMDGALSDARQNLIDLGLDAIRNGAMLPDTLEPFFRRLEEMGLLVDENGERLFDLGQLNFGEIVDDQLVRIAEILESIRDLLTGIPGDVDEVGKSLQGLGPRIGRLPEPLSSAGMPGRSGMPPINSDSVDQFQLAEKIGAEVAQQLRAIGGDQTQVNAYFDGYQIMRFMIDKLKRNDGGGRPVGPLTEIKEVLGVE